MNQIYENYETCYTKGPYRQQLKEGGGEVHPCNFDCRGIVMTDSPLVCDRFRVGWCVNWGLMIVRGRGCVEFSICDLGGGGYVEVGVDWWVVEDDSLSIYPFSVAQRVSVLAVWVDDRSRVGSFLVEFPVSLDVGNFFLSVELCPKSAIYRVCDGR